MIETFIALLLAHVLADFAFQSEWIVAKKRTPVGLGIHLAIVYLTAVAVTGSLNPALLALAILHIGIDVGKLTLCTMLKSSHGFGPFMIDQTLHLASLLAFAIWLPNLWTQGLWATVGAPTELPSAMALLAGLLVSTKAGLIVVGLVLARLDQGDLPEGLPKAGALIGVLERGMIFILVLAQETEVIGFLIAAKSILQLNVSKEGIAARQYIIIGTLASFGWALITAYATLAALSLLPPLGFLPQTP